MTFSATAQAMSSPPSARVRMLPPPNAMTTLHQAPELLRGPCNDDPFEEQMLWAFRHNQNVFVSARSTVMPASVAQGRLAHLARQLGTMCSRVENDRMETAAPSPAIATAAAASTVPLTQHQQRRRLLREMPCAKCKTARPKVVVRQDAFCVECFQRNVGAKFRTVLGKLRTPVEDAGGRAQMMVAYSGGTASRVLLQLADEYNKASRSQRFAGFYLCHVDESALAQDQDAATAFLEGVRRVAAEFTFTYVEEKLENIFDSDDPASMPAQKHWMLSVMPTRLQSSSIFAEELRAVLQQTTLCNAEKLRLLFSRIQSATTREDILEYFRQVLLRRAARRHECAAVWTADTATRVAIRTIANMAKGRGATLSHETAQTSELDEHGIAVWRPMRDTLDKEAVLYVYQRALSMPPPLRWPHHHRPRGKASIGRLSQDFIVGLERDFPATANTVTRTVGKLTPSAALDPTRRCPLCQRPADQDAADWNRLCTVATLDALRAGLADAKNSLPNLPLTFSDVVVTSSSTTGDRGDAKCGDTTAECCGSVNAGASTSCCENKAIKDSGTDDKPIDLLPTLCYGCFVNMRDLPAVLTFDPSRQDVDVCFPLPTFVGDMARQRVREEQLREHIQDFLLDDSDEGDANDEV
ncbi:hypothetical protein THASP1DRAFT_30279 [Thamnocephalis sphaerospora]|uniref:Cytoplasmic tRNA 2-thiolation protein 2 n=1 Tax=Thamnocephalis sphaerospora TaxID=78915 RepID=A0A4P9XQW5_9FUNG|nr:hypothetical protein THASP1DRAFT_30279 [Thamnocephalis sphaerospora]|eukprot:RKP07901.1 hypothetical protein THASP1DRAFT_30279 [Thamnocephalis sphaerospora]